MNIFIFDRVFKNSESFRIFEFIESNSQFWLIAGVNYLDKKML